METAFRIVYLRFADPNAVHGYYQMPWSLVCEFCRIEPVEDDFIPASIRTPEPDRRLPRHHTVEPLRDTSAGPRKIDLPGINEKQLREAGVGDIWVARECTFCEARKYYSFRREKEQAGRMISFVGRLQ